MYPPYSRLPSLDGSPDRHAWAVEMGDAGTLSRITESVRRQALAAVGSGRVVALSLPLDHPVGALSPDRAVVNHVELLDRGGSDDRLDGYFPQGSSHWDGLRHVRHGKQGYFGGLSDEALDDGRLGIDRMAPAGIVTRGVLVDIVSFRGAIGRRIDPESRDLVSVTEVEQALERQGSTLASGDILLVRTGWVDWFNDLAPSAVDALRGSMSPGGLRTPGLEPSQEMAAWLWDRGVAAVAADNPAVEALPIVGADGFLHRRALALLGIPFGELWTFKELAGACTAEGRYDFLLVSVPLLLPKGSGSPANAVAVF